MSLPHSSCWAITILSLARRPMAGIGWSARAVAHCRTGSSAGVIGPRHRLFPTPLGISPNACASALPLCSRMSTRPRIIGVGAVRTEAAALPCPQMLLEARHEFDEVAGPVAIVELVHEDAVPGVAAGARRAGQREEIGAACHAA